MRTVRVVIIGGLLSGVLSVLTPLTHGAVAESCVDRCQTLYTRCTRPCNRESQEGMAKAMGALIGTLATKGRGQVDASNNGTQEANDSMKCMQQCQDEQNDCIEDCGSQDQ